MYDVWLVGLVINLPSSMTEMLLPSSNDNDQITRFSVSRLLRRGKFYCSRLIDGLYRRQRPETVLAAEDNQCGSCF